MTHEIDQITETVEGTAFAERKAALDGYKFWFKGHALVDGISIKAKLQIANTMCINVVLYLISVVPMSEDVLKKLNSTMRKIGRAIYGYPVKASVKTLQKELPFYPAEASIATQASRNLLATLAHREQKNPATRLLHFQSRHPQLT
jgi:hypothetical protein